MDFKKLSIFIIVLGLLILAVGGGMYIKNRQVSARGGILGQLKALDQNMYRKPKRETATKVIIAGAIVSFVGVGVMVSAKKK